MVKKKKSKKINGINKEAKLIEWASQNPYLTDSLKMNWLSEHNGSCSIMPVSGETSVLKYMDGTNLKHYDFMFSVMLPFSDTTDALNVENIFNLRQWQNWIDEMENMGNYPDFGENCCDYELLNLSNVPNLALVYDNGMAKYQFPARLCYAES